MNTIKIENIGPIHHLSIPLPDGGGVVVLRGRNGVGKTHALEAVDALISGSGRPPCRDGAAKGRVEGCGVTLTIGRSQRRTGEAEVQSLEGRLDITQLVDPPIQDPEAADARRIKALIQLSGQQATLADFVAQAPAAAGLGPLAADDPVVLAGRIKRALEAEARRHEQQAEKEHIAAEAEQRQAGEWKPEQLAISVEQAQVELTRALSRLAELDRQAQLAAETQWRVLRAQELLNAMRKEAGREPTQIEDELEFVTRDIAQLEKALAAARERRAQLARELREAQERTGRIAELERQLADVVPAVDPAEMASAKQAVAQAQEQYDQAVRVAQSWQHARQADVHRQAARQHEQQAEQLREQAQATDVVLTEMVGRITSRLRVEAGRLVTNTERGTELFSDLSTGEKWRLALEIAVGQVGRGGLLTIPQEAWEGLDPINREEVARMAAEVGVVLITAEPSESSELETVILEGQS